jgi:hypothetical protein
MTTAIRSRTTLVRRALFATFLSAVATILIPSWGCSGSAAKSSPVHSTGTLGGAGGHAIHVFAVNPDGTKTALAFGQGTEIHASLGPKLAAPERPNPAGRALGLLHRLAAKSGNVRSTVNGGTAQADPPPVQTPPTVGNPTAGA